MTDVADRLKAFASSPDVYDPPTPEECRAAADEIQRLRTENERMASLLPSSAEAAAYGGGFNPYNP